MLEFMVKVRAFTMNSRRLLLFVESVMVALPFTSNACTYETRDEKEERAIVDASIGDSEMHKIDRTGGAKSVVLIRGNGQVVALGNYNWDESDVYTVQFATTPNNSPNGASLPAGTVPTITYAIVRWTIDGNDMVRVISVGNGVSLAGVGRGATVQVYDATQLPGGSDPVPQYTVTCNISRGTRGSAINPPTFFPKALDQLTGGASFGIISPSGFHDQNIPVNSGAISVQVTADTPGVSPDLGLVVQQQGNAGVLKQYNTNVYGGSWIPLDPAATLIRLINANAGAGQNAYFGIAFGIDG